MNNETCEERHSLKTPENHFIFETIESGGCRIIKYKGEIMSKKRQRKNRNKIEMVYIPETIKGEPVREIGADTFIDWKKDICVFIPENIIEKDGIILKCNGLIDLNKPYAHTGIKNYMYKVYFIESDVDRTE